MNSIREISEDLFLRLRLKGNEINAELRGKDYHYVFLIGVDDITRNVRLRIIDAAERALYKATELR